MIARWAKVVSASILAAACGSVRSEPSILIRGSQLTPQESERIRDHCLLVSRCLQERLGWQTPSSVTVDAVPRLQDSVAGASDYAEGYSERESALIVIETGALANTPEVLSHELAHLALPAAYDGIDQALREALCNVAAIQCAQSSAEVDRLYAESVIGVLNATGGIAFAVSWQRTDGNADHAEVTFDPGAGAYLSHAVPRDSDADAEGTVRRMRAMVATFAVAADAQRRGSAVAFRDVLDVGGATGSSYPELEIAKRCGMPSIDDLRHVAANEVDREELARIVVHEARWLYPRLRAYGIDLAQDASTTESSNSVRIALAGSDISIMPADLGDAASRKVSGVDAPDR